RQIAANASILFTTVTSPLRENVPIMFATIRPSISLQGHRNHAPVASSGTIRHQSPNARERVAVARDPSPAHFTEESCNGAQRLARPTLAAKRIRPDEDARVVHWKRGDVLIERARLAVLKQILFDV